MALDTTGIVTIVAGSINLLFALGFLFRFFQYKVRSYLWLSIALLLLVGADVIIALLGSGVIVMDAAPVDLNDTTVASNMTMSFNGAIGTLGMIMYGVSGTLSILCYVIFDLVVLSLLRTWIESMRNAGRPATSKLNTSFKMSTVIRIAIVLMGVLYIAFLMVLVTTGWVFSLLALLVAVGIQLLAYVGLASISLWLWLDTPAAADKIQSMKRTQIIRIFILVFFGGITYGYAGFYGSAVGYSIAWFFKCIVALWPRALVEYDIPTTPLAYAAPGMPGFYNPATKV
jgi:hypothetical protein